MVNRKLFIITFAIIIGLALASQLSTVSTAMAAVQSSGNQFSPDATLSIQPRSGFALLPAQQITTTLTTEAITQTVTTALVLPDVDPANILTFSQLGTGEISLNGPYDGDSVVYSLPASWELTPGATIDLLFSASIFSSATANVDNPAVYGGTLTISFNDVTVATLRITQNGDQYQQITIPDEALVPSRSDGRHDLSFSLDSGETCDIDEQFSLVIRPASRFVLPHTLISPTTDLARFPQPFSRDEAWPDSLVIVLPDQPSAVELQSAMTVGAGLGNLTSSTFTMSITTESQLTEAERTASHIVMVGKASSLLSLSSLNLAAPLSADGFAIPDSEQEDGIIQSILSPWNPTKIILVVSGATDAGVLKAGQAISTGFIRPAGQSDIAVVASVETQPLPYAVPVNQKLSDLGYDLKNTTNRLNRPGISSSIFYFYAPSGQIPTPDAYFELQFNHSALLNFNRSGLVVLLNEQPVGSFQFTSETAQKTNSVRFSIPALALLPGRNKIEVRASLIPVDQCTTPALAGMWIAISPESNLHLPMNPATAGIASFFDLSLYPQPFVLHPTMDNTAIVLAKADLPAWNTALKLAADLGDRLNGQMITLGTYFADELTETVKSEDHLLVVGRPSQLSIIAEINDQLPGVFDLATDRVLDPKTQVVYRLGANTDVGYLELLRSPWNRERVVYMVLGSSNTGVDLAVNALEVSSLRSKLAGDFAMVTAQQISAIDSRTGVAEVVDISPTDGQEEPEPVEPTTPIAVQEYTAQRPGWILPVLLAAIALMLLTIVFVIIRGMRRG